MLNLYTNLDINRHADWERGESNKVLSNIE